MMAEQLLMSSPRRPIASLPGCEEARLLRSSIVVVFVIQRSATRASVCTSYTAVCCAYQALLTQLDFFLIKE